MILHISIHHPDPAKADELVEAMRHFESQMRAQPGVLSAHTLKDASTGALVSLAVYSGKETWLAAQPAIASEDFTRWEGEPPLVFHLEEV
jgi:hypothetical protein